MFAFEADVEDAEDEEPALRPHGLPFSTRLTVPRRTRIAAAAVLGLIVLSLGPMTAFFVQIALGPLRPGTESLSWALAAVTGTAMVLLAGRQLIRIWPPGRVRSDGYMLVVEHPMLLRRPYTVPLEGVRAITVDPDGDLRFAVYDDSPWSVPVHGGAEPLVHLWGGGGSPVPLIDLTPDTPNVAVVLEEPLQGPAVRRTPFHGKSIPPRITGFLLRVDAPERFLDSGAVRDLRIEDLRALDVPVR